MEHVTGGEWIARGRERLDATEIYAGLREDDLDDLDTEIDLHPRLDEFFDVTETLIDEDTHVGTRLPSSIRAELAAKQGRHRMFESEDPVLRVLRERRDRQLADSGAG